MSAWESSDYYSFLLFNSVLDESFFTDIEHSPPRTYSPLSLQCICTKIIIEQGNLLPNKLENSLEIYCMNSFLSSLALNDDDAKESGLTQSVIANKKSLQLTFPALLERFGKEYLESRLERSLFEELYASYEREQAVKKRMRSYRTGVVIESSKVVTTKQNDGYYPLSALLQGVEWPVDVDPTKREEYLNPQEFLRVFGMTKESFNSLPKYTRVRLKKEQRLF